MNIWYSSPSQGKLGHAHWDCTKIEVSNCVWPTEIVHQPIKQADVGRKKPSVSAPTNLVGRGYID
jgi:hypothetical protein